MSFPHRPFLFLVFLLPWPLVAAVGGSPEKRSISLGEGVEISFVAVPAGTFLMGSPAAEKGRDPDESPQHEVQVAAFFIGVTEVTQAQWLAVMGYNPSTFQQTPTHLSHPVETVSWQECQAFIKKLNRLGKGTFRLPTEAEWEYACRAGTTTSYYWGEVDGDWEIYPRAWINSRSMATTHPVGTKPSNPWGLYDMAGSVWEWTSTAYHRYGEEPGNPDQMVFRGGSWFDFGKSQRSANRHRHGIEQKYTSIGLRLVWSDE